MQRTDNGDIFSYLPTLICLGAAAAFMAVSTAIYWPNPELAFLSDNTPVSWLSSAQLWALALLCLRLALDKTLPRILGILLTLAMVLLAFDEQFMLHEQWKYGCHAWLEICRYRWVTEAPVILVGVIGSATVFLLHQQLPRGAARVVLWSALGTGIFAILLDLTSQPALFTAYEEGFEVLAEALFTGALLGWRRLAVPQVHSP